MVALCVVATFTGETIDRIVVVVGRQVITELQLEEELRVTSFLNEQPIGADEGQRRSAANRLIDQALIRREMDLAHYPTPDEGDLNSAVEKIQVHFGGPKNFVAELAKYKLTESALRSHLALQAATLRFIEYRFRPEGTVSEQRVQEQRTDEALSRWLSQERDHTEIHYLDTALRSPQP